MNVSNASLAALLLLLSGVAAAELSAEAVPATSTWYFHADFEAMRTSDAGKPIYGWLQREVFDDIREDAGVDLDEEVDRITGLSDEASGTVVLVEGRVSQQSKDKLLALAAGAESLETLKHEGRTFYHAEDDRHRKNGSVEIDSFEDGVYFSFELENRIVAASTRERLVSMLESDGKLLRHDAANGTLVVLTAEHSLIQAGMQADQIEDRGEGGWQSNILRNTEQIAVMIADTAGELAVETQLIAKQPEMAESLASIVRGLISLTIFSDDMDPEISRLLQATSVDVDGPKLKIRVSVDPEAVVAVLDD